MPRIAQTLSQSGSAEKTGDSVVLARMSKMNVDSNLHRYFTARDMLQVRIPQSDSDVCECGFYS